MRLSPAEQTLWYLNIAAALFLLVRLYSQQLVKIYPALFTYFAADALQQIVALTFGRSPKAYAEIYFVGQALKVALAVWVVLELYQLALAQQPALAKFGRRTLDYLFCCAVLVGLVNFVFQIGANPGKMKYPTAFTRLESTVALVTLIVLVLITGFLLWFPVRASRNVALCLGAFVFYYFQRWAGLMFTTFWPLRTHEFSNVMLTASFICFVIWGIALRGRGEATTVITGHRWNPKEAERLTLQLDAINSRLVRLVARP
jgi:hypothetical protein